MIDVQRRRARRARCQAHGRDSRRRGAVAALVVLTVPVMLSVAALTIDLSFVGAVRQDLQTAADAGAMAGVWTMFDKSGQMTADLARQQAALLAGINHEGGSHEVTLGFIADPMDPNSPFVPSADVDANAIRVVSRRTTQTGNAVPLFFALIFGRTSTDVSAMAVAMLTTPATADIVPLALKTPGFGPIDPDISEANPGKDGPSEPENGMAFEIGEQVTLFTFGKGKKSPVHLILNTNSIPGEAQIGKVLRGEDPPVPLSIGDELPVLGEGTGHNGLGGKLADRLDDGNPNNLVVVVPIVETLMDTRNVDGELTGNVRVVDFAAVRLDAVIEVEVPDPNDPQDNGKTITIEILVGTIVQMAITGSGLSAGGGFVASTSVGVPQIIR